MLMDISELSRKHFRVLHKGAVQQEGNAHKHICTIKSAEELFSMATPLGKPVLQSPLLNDCLIVQHGQAVISEEDFEGTEFQPLPHAECTMHPVSGEKVSRAIHHPESDSSQQRPSRSGRRVLNQPLQSTCIAGCRRMRRFR